MLYEEYMSILLMHVRETLHRYELTTLTTCLAASSAGNPRHDLAAISEDNASQIPSDAIISRPPAVDNFYNDKTMSGHKPIADFQLMHGYFSVCSQKHRLHLTNRL